MAEELGARFLLDSVRRVDAAEHALELDGGGRLDYDYAVVCTGGRFHPAFDGVTTFPAREPLRINELLRADGRSGHIFFVVPSGVTWALPIYEIALMTQRRALELGTSVELTVVTPEEAPLAVFGPAASAAVSELLSARGIAVETAAHAHQESASEIVLTPGGRRIAVADVIALPAMAGPAIDGLPSDEDGFIPIDGHARIVGVDDVYAAGDGTNFPIKQGGIATQEADAAAADIAHRLGAAVDAEPFRPVLRGKLLTGEESLQLRSEIAGGGGEGAASLDALWWPPHKISGRYLAPWLYHGEVHAEPEPPGRTIDIDVALPLEWHEEPMALDPYRSVEID